MGGHNQKKARGRPRKWPWQKEAPKEAPPGPPTPAEQAGESVQSWSHSIGNPEGPPSFHNSLSGFLENNPSEQRTVCLNLLIFRASTADSSMSLQVIDYLAKKGYSRTEAMLRMESANQEIDGRPLPPLGEDARPKFKQGFGE